MPVNGYPNWQERTMHVLNNVVRMDPHAYKMFYMADFSDGFEEGNTQAWSGSLQRPAGLPIREWSVWLRPWRLP